MDEHDLLIRHLRGWAQQKKRPQDPDLVALALDLRWRHDELEAGDWPPGSAERLVLTTWPGYANELPDPRDLEESLDTLWRFLRATGRMRRTSASPPELRAELRRSLPDMPTAMAVPARHSTGRTLMEFGRTIGIDLEDAADLDEAQVKLDALQAAWNALPQEERLRRMPDPSPKGVVGRRWSGLANASRDERAPSPRDEEMLTRADPAVAAQDARSSAFVDACLRLADWVGDGREVTSTGVLRPAVARQAYRELDLWSWERGWEEVRWARLDERFDEPLVERIRAETAAEAWTSANDCFPLERLWWPAQTAGLIEVRGRKALASSERPRSDQDWCVLAQMLLLGLAQRLGSYGFEPLVGPLLAPLLTQDESVPLSRIESAWLSKAPVAGAVDTDLMREIYDDRLRTAWYDFDDANVWRRDGAQLQLTALGHDFALMVSGALEDGFMDLQG